MTGHAAPLHCDRLAGPPHAPVGLKTGLVRWRAMRMLRSVRSRNCTNIIAVIDASLNASDQQARPDESQKAWQHLPDDRRRSCFSRCTRHAHAALEPIEKLELSLQSHDWTAQVCAHRTEEFHAMRSLNSCRVSRRLRGFVCRGGVHGAHRTAKYDDHHKKAVLRHGPAGRRCTAALSAALCHADRGAVTNRRLRLPLR